MNDSAVYTLRPTGLDAVTLHVSERGHGRPVLLLHGGAGPQSVTDFANRLAHDTRTRVITPTHPGFAGTPRPQALDSAAALASTYLTLLEELDLVDVTVVGNSVGGWIAAEMATSASARIARLTLLDATGIEVPGDAVADVSTMTVPELFARSFRNAAPFLPNPAPLTPDARTTTAGNLAALAVYGRLKPGGTRLLDRLPNTSATALVLWGDSDRITDQRVGHAWADALPRSTFQLLPDTGHLPHVETPEQVVTALTAFLTETAAWEHDYTANTTAPPDAVWTALRNLYTGTTADPHGDTITIHGPFTAGTALTVQPQGTDITVECTITNIIDGHQYAYRSNFNGLYLTSRHTLTRLPGGGTQINHHSQIAGPAAEIIGPRLGARITNDRADTMHNLIAAASALGHNESATTEAR